MHLVALLLSFLFQAPSIYHNDKPAFELELPAREWKRFDQSSGTIVAVVFSPVPDLSIRCSVLRFPQSFLPKGLETREAQIQEKTGSKYERVSLGDGTIAGRQAKRWEYKTAGATTVEWAFPDGETIVVYQIAAPTAFWDKPERKARLDAITASFKWIGGEAAAPSLLDDTTPATIRDQRRSAREAHESQKYSITSHRITASIEPAKGSVAVTDVATVVTAVPDVKEVRFFTTFVTVDRVESETKMSWRIDPSPQADAIVVEFAEPLVPNQEVALTIHTSSDDYFASSDQGQVAEISVFGQVRAKSTFSSHVLWYPIDEKNDAAVDITLDVPKPYVALTGGEAKDRTETGDRVAFRYVDTSRVPRQLPFGFAIGEYESREVKSEHGLTLSVHYFAGEEKLAQQRIEALAECAEVFERAFGPLPWKTVRFVHVSPERKQTGVSLPGMILVSDGYFPDLESVDASDGNLSDPKALGLLVIADELCHQWNFYAAGLPNELAEGVSTYTNALFLERRYGAAAYEKAIAYCRGAWLSSSGLDREHAIASPAVYSNKLYRPTVFCKTPVVLAVLRRKLGDERFFSGLRRAFAAGDPAVDGFDRFEQGFAEPTDTELRAFFEQWFFRPGSPSIEISHERSEKGVRVAVKQTQPGDAYVLDLRFEITCEDGSKHTLAGTVGAKEQSLDFDLSSPPTAVALAERAFLPARNP